MTVKSLEKRATAARAPGSPGGFRFGKTEVSGLIAEANQPAEVDFLRGLARTATFMPGARKPLDQFLDAQPEKPVRDFKMGFLPMPGDELRGRTLSLKAGETFSFETRGNQIRGLAHVTSKGLSPKSRVLEAMKPNVLGSTTLTRWSVTVPKNAKAGTTYSLKLVSTFMARDLPEWNTTFKIKVVK